MKLRKLYCNLYVNLIYLIIINAITLTKQEYFGEARAGYLTYRTQKHAHSFKLVCYMTNWAQYRPNATRFVPSDLDPFLCTHVIYAFAAINVSNHQIKAFEWNDESKDLKMGRYEELNNLKLVNPKLKTLLAVGGWNMGSGPFSDMCKNETNRKVFIRSTVDLLRKYKFDGLDLDWEFPAKREGSRVEDKQHFTYLVRDLREAFYNEALATRREQLLLTSAVAAEKLTILKAYDIEGIVSHVDWINIMSYDYHGSWDNKLGHNSPLYSAQNENEDDKRLNVDWTVKLYYTLGMPLEKLVLGLPFYGRSFTLKSMGNVKFGSESSDAGRPGESTRENGFLSYGLEICKYLKKDNWTRGWSPDHQVPYAFKDNQWVGYDDEESIEIKVDYINKYCLGGAMIWSIDLDDFKGYCSSKTYPLTRAIQKTLKKMNRKKCLPLAKIQNDKEVNDYLLSSSKSYPVSAESAEDNEEAKKGVLNFVTQQPTKPNIFIQQNKFPIIISQVPIQSFPTLKQITTTTTKKTISTLGMRPSFFVPNLNTIEKTYEIENRSDKLNDLMMIAYQNSLNQNSNYLVDDILKRVLNNMSNYDTYGRVQTFANIPLFNTQRNFRLQNLNPITTPSTKSQKQEQKVLFLDDKMNENKQIKSNYGCEQFEDGEFVRDPADCSSFFTCFMGKATKRSTCEPGLAFDIKLKVCNWKENVIC